MKSFGDSLDEVIRGLEPGSATPLSLDALRSVAPLGSEEEGLEVIYYDKVEFVPFNKLDEYFKNIALTAYIFLASFPDEKTEAAQNRLREFAPRFGNIIGEKSLAILIEEEAIRKRHSHLFERFLKVFRMHPIHFPLLAVTNAPLTFTDGKLDIKWNKREHGAMVFKFKGLEERAVAEFLTYMASDLRKQKMPTELHLKIKMIYETFKRFYREHPELKYLVELAIKIVGIWVKLTPPRSTK
ncbi:MAG: hypothetical protein QXR19_14410 [Candidatus Jordarchaeaceae archaeon]